MEEIVYLPKRIYYCQIVNHPLYTYNICVN